MNILLVAATPFEIAPTLKFLEKNFVNSGQTFKNGTVSVEILVTGAGLLATATQLSLLLARRRFDLVLNAGVAGSFTTKIPPGSVVEVISETLGDFGVEERDGSFVPLFTMDWMDENAPPFVNGQLLNPTGSEFQFLPPAHGLTVQRVSGSAESIAATRRLFPEVQVESMESAAIFYVCALVEQPFLAVRAISNFVEPRNRANWKLELAINNLNEVLRQILAGLE